MNPNILLQNMKKAVYNHGIADAVKEQQQNNF